MFDFITGETLLINKPLHWTSFDVVKKIKYLSRAKKVGHAGTLDPLADGLLILCTGKHTKNIQDIQGADKTYTGNFFLGATTPSYDLETEVNQEFDIKHVDEKLIQETTKQFLGKIQQTPPIYSAVKVSGKRAYALARQGETPELKSKEIEIKNFEITSIQLPIISFKVICTKGTYIRSLANDFGKALGAGAYLQQLTRTQIGEYRLEDALSIEQFQHLMNPTSDENS